MPGRSDIVTRTVGQDLRGPAMQRSTVPWRPVATSALLAALLAGPCGATDTEDPPRPSLPCKERGPETQESLRQMLERLARPADPARWALSDRLRCAVLQYPDLAARLLPALLHTPDPVVQAMVAKSLGALGPNAAGAVPGLVALLHSSHENVRVVAAQALARIGPRSEPAVDPLIVLLKDPSPKVRREAAHSLASIGPAAARGAPAIARLLRDPHPQVRGTASFALQELAHQGLGALPVLMGLLRDEDPEVRTRAAVALGHLGPLGGEARAVLEALRDDPGQQDRVRRAARTALSRLDLPTVVQVQRERAGYLLPMILPRLQDPDPGRRREGVALIGYLGEAGRSARDRVLTLVDDPDAGVRVAAVRVLGNLGS